MMWMMGYNDAGTDFDTIQDPYPARKHRPLLPRPPPCLTSIHTNDLLAINHHLAMAAQQTKRSSEVTNNQQVVVSSRWNPTPEQLQTLEDLYRSGTRTPSAEQIQHITGELRKYGKIEGKNVFYWFQNHKARERQKRRRQQLESLSDEPQKKELPPGPNKTAFEVEQTKNWASPTNSSTLPEKTTGEAECKAAEDDIDVAELQQQQQQRRNATWQMMHHLSFCSPSTSSSAFSPPTTTTNNNYNRHLIIPCSSSSVTSPTITINHPSNPQLDHFVNFHTKPYTSCNLNHHQYRQHLSELEDSQTLQLFPLESGLSDRCDQEEEEEEEEEDEAEDGQNIGDDDHVAPYQFFEFLPLKN